MKAISTVEELEKFMSRHPGRWGDIDTLEPLPVERLEQWVMSGRTVMVPETPQEEQEAAAGLLAATLRKIARNSGWKEAARHFLRVGDQPPLTGARLAYLAAFLRKKFKG